MVDEREEMYDMIYKESYKERGVVDETSSPQPAEAAKNTEEVKEEEKKVANSGVTEISPEKEISGEGEESKESKESSAVEGVEETPQEKEGKPKGERVVPLASLHEEREKRKKIRSEYEVQIDSLKKERDEILGFLHDYTKKDDEESLDYDSQLRMTREEVGALRDKLLNVERTIRTEEKQKEYQRVIDLVSTTDKELKEEGFAGFSKFKDLVAHEIVNLPAEEKKKADNDPSEWKRIYKEVVYPEVSEVFGESIQKRNFSEKEKLKESVQMLGERKSETNRPKTESWSYDEYMQERLKRNA